MQPSTAVRQRRSCDVQRGDLLALIGARAKRRQPPSIVRSSASSWQTLRRDFGMPPSRRSSLWNASSASPAPSDNRPRSSARRPRQNRPERPAPVGIGSRSALSVGRQRPEVAVELLGAEPLLAMTSEDCLHGGIASLYGLKRANAASTRSSGRWSRTARAFSRVVTTQMVAGRRGSFWERTKIGFRAPVMRQLVRQRAAPNTHKRRLWACWRRSTSSSHRPSLARAACHVQRPSDPSKSGQWSS